MPRGLGSRLADNLRILASRELQVIYWEVARSSVAGSCMFDGSRILG